MKIPRRFFDTDTASSGAERHRLEEPTGPDASPAGETQLAAHENCGHFQAPIPINPAPGYRTSGSGDPVRVGYYGFSWSSATGGIGGLDLYFSSQYLYASHSDNRAYGFQLRCLSE